MRDAQRPKVSFGKIAFGLIVSGVCLYFVLRGVNWGLVWQHLTQVNPLLFLVSMLSMLFAYFLMTWRWQHLLDPLEVPGPGQVLGVRGQGSGVSADAQHPIPNTQYPTPNTERPTPNTQHPIPNTQYPIPNTQYPTPSHHRGVREHASLMSLYGKMMTGYFFNAFFPARAGDLVRAYLLGRRTGLRKTTVLATIVIEKAFDGMALLLMLLVSLVLLPTVGSSTTKDLAPSALAWVAGLALVAAIAALVLFYRYSNGIAAITARIMGRLPLPERVRHLPVRLIETFASGMHVFKSPGPLVSAALISLLVWVAAALMFLAALLSFKASFPPDVTGIVGLLFLTALVNLGLLIPALPGNVGTYEALVVAGMAFFRVDKELAVAFALIFHVGQLVVTLIVGLIAFWAQNLSLAQIQPVEHAAETEAETTLEQVERESGAAYAASDQ